MARATFVHPELGAFEAKNALQGVVVGKMVWMDSEIELRLTDDGGPWEQAAEHALTFAANDRVWSAEIADHVYKKLYQTWNDSWRDENEASLTKEAWASRMTPTSVELSGEGYFTMGLHDGDLFWGHKIIVWGSLERSVLDVTLFG